MISKNDNRNSRITIIVRCVIVFLAFLSFSLISAGSAASRVPLGIAFFAVTSLLLILAEYAVSFFSLKLNSGLNSAQNPILQNITLQFIRELYLPIVICSDSGKIIYCNDSISALMPENFRQTPKNIGEICNVSIAEIAAATESDGIKAEAFGNVYSIKAYKIEAQGSHYYITLWNERSEIASLTKRLADEQTVVAYIIIDNVDELSQAVREKTREATHSAEMLLKEWAQSVGGVIKEYERNKYLFFFESRYLDRFIEDKFNIREKIHEIKVGETNLSLTISIGVARFHGTLAEREAGAQNALEYALKRGGDTAVFYNGNENVSFDGRVKTTSKSTQVRARMTAAKITELMEEAGNVLIMGHSSPDYDSIGACVGVARLALSVNVKPKLVLNTENINAKQCLKTLDGGADYENMFIDPISAEDLIRSDTLCIVVDVNNPLRFESTTVAENSGKVIIIDHHSKMRPKDAPQINAEIEYIEPYASSASELVAEFLEHQLPMGTLPAKEALLLFCGILLDTKQFTRNAGVRTFSAAQYLRSEGASPADAQLFFEATLDEYKRAAVCAADAKIYREHFAIALGTPSGDYDDRIIAAKVADILLDLKGVYASFAVFEINNVIHISARSSGKVNVASILEGIGGGGYYESAGAQIKGVSLDEVLHSLKEKIDAYVNGANAV